MPRGVDFKVPMKDVREAHAAHMAGWSLRALARMHYRQWGYASPTSAAMGLSSAMRALDLPVRDRVEATRLAHVVHGELSRDATRDPSHPDHAKALERRRWNREQKRKRDEWMDAARRWEIDFCMGQGSSVPDVLADQIEKEAP